MSAIDDVAAFIGLVRLNPEVSNFVGPCTEEVITQAEASLGVNFPASYREFVRELGECDIAGEEFYGVWTRLDSPTVNFGSVRMTLEARRTSGMPEALIAFMSDGMGGLYVIDAGSFDNEGEAPVLVWEPGGSNDANTPERVSASFGNFALGRAQRALAAL